MERQWGLDVLRVISMAAVVVIHTACQYWYTLDVRSFQWNVMNFYDSAARWAVPVFVMISGALFLDPKKDYPIKKMYTKYIFRIALIIILWGLFYSAWDVVAGGGSASLKPFLKAWLFGHYHMWFLFMLLGLYIVTPILRCVVKNEIATKYFLILGFILNAAIPLISSLFQIAFLNDYVGTMMIQIPIGYSYYYVLGYWLNQSTFDRRKRSLVLIAGVIGFLLLVFLTALQSLELNKPIEAYYDYLSLPAMLESVAVFVLLRGCKVERMSSRRVIGVLSKASLGVYLIHPFVLDVLYKFGLNSMSFNPILAVPVVVLITVFASFGITILLERIPIFNKYFI